MVTSTKTRAEEVLRSIESLSHERSLPIIGPVKGKLLEEVVREQRPKRVLEVGTLVGYSAILIARNLPPDGRLITLEVNPNLARRARENIKRAGFDDRVTVIEGDALLTIPTVRGPFQMLFLDATKEQYIKYLRLAENKLEPSGVVVADNAGVFASAMADYLEYVRESGCYRSRFHDFGFDGMEVSIKLD